MFTCLNKYFQKLCYAWQIRFLVFVTNYPTSWQLLMDIIFVYPLTGQFDTI